MKKKNLLEDCATVFSFAIIFIVVQFLLDLIFGNDIAEFEWLEEFISGLVAGTLILLLRKYEEKKFKS